MYHVLFDWVRGPDGNRFCSRSFLLKPNTFPSGSLNLIRLAFYHTDASKSAFLYCASESHGHIQSSAALHSPTRATAHWLYTGILSRFLKIARWIAQVTRSLWSKIHWEASRDSLTEKELVLNNEGFSFSAWFCLCRHAFILLFVMLWCKTAKLKKPFWLLIAFASYKNV